MSATRVEVINYGAFDAREWLRRDVLWASLMSPYSQQMSGWIDGTQKAQHDGNVSRQNLYAQNENAEAQAMAFFNQGKNVAGLISSVALFQASIAGTRQGAPVTPIAIQAKAVDLVLDSEVKSDRILPESEVYERCSRLAVQASLGAGIVASRSLRKASQLMTDVAVVEASSWVAASLTDETLSKLTINDGGHPRSAGPRVEMLQPLFKKVLASETYQSLGVS
jgi:hypothetical protein